ncbi:winged helix-turn-helix domain-containing protein [Rouxiella sp. WC2420]|uniref:Winged helix-turn-helix domain-containing protein n=1 Tax=Rouxiella sp. WC2420 TaxID=3234145 RepID=A0AB39VLF2_9GAMM
MLKKKGVNNVEYKFHDYILTKDNQLIQNSKFIRAGAKELSVLRVLIESAGTVVDKNDLLDKVWGCAMVSEESLARCIYVLRKLFKQNKSNNYIQTIYSKGYIFVAEVCEHLPIEKELVKAEPSISHQEIFESLFGKGVSFIEILGQQHVAIDVKILLPTNEFFSKKNES